jgi:hypothetical protein
VEGDADGGPAGWDQLLGCGQGCSSFFVATTPQELLECQLEAPLPECSGSGGRYSGQSLLLCAIAGPLFPENLDAGPAELDADAGTFEGHCADVCFPGLALTDP